jgi:hypothetical protein
MTTPLVKLKWNDVGHASKKDWAALCGGGVLPVHGARVPSEGRAVRRRCGAVRLLCRTDKALVCDEAHCPSPNFGVNAQTPTLSGRS